MCAKYEPTRLPGYSNEDILAEIGRVAKAEFAGRAPTPTEFRNSSARVNYVTLLARFNTYAEAMKQAGLPYSHNTVSISDIVADLRKVLAANNGHYFTQNFYKTAGGRCHPKTIRKRFGSASWAALLQQVLGVSPMTSMVRTPKVKAPRVKPATPSEDQLFEEMRRVWDSLGKQPTFDQFPKLARIRRSVYCRAFGKWPKAILRFCTNNPGYRPSSKCRQHADASDILVDIQMVLARNPKATLLYKTYRNWGGIYSLKTIRHHFKGWIQALQHLGISPNRAEQRYSNEELYREIQRVWELLGRQPHYGDMKRNRSKVSAFTIAARFDGWTKAIHAFSADREKGDDKDTAPSSVPEEHWDAARALSKQPDRLIEVKTLVAATVTGNRTPRAPGWRLRHQVFVRDQFKCKYCGRSPATHPGVTLEPDHIIPYSKGGETVLVNLQLLCQECNGGKSDSMPPNVGGYQEQQGPINSGLPPAPGG